MVQEKNKYKSPASRVRGDSSTNTIDVKRIIKDRYLFYKSNNLDKMIKLLERYKLPKLTEELYSEHIPVSSKQYIYIFVKLFPERKFRLT